MGKGIVIASAIGAAIVGGAFAAPVFYVIEPGAVTTPAPGFVSGEFHVRKAPFLKPTPRFPFFATYGSTSRLGGACLVADPADVRVHYPGDTDDHAPGPTCMNDDSCKVPEGYATQGMHGYCDIVTNKCWVRPGSGERGKDASAPFCNRSVDKPDGVDKQWPAGTYPANRQPLARASIPSGQRVTWRVVACHNKGSGCVDRMGDPRTLDSDE